MTDNDPDNPGRNRLTFSAVEGFEPPPVEELAEAGPAD